MRTWLLGFILGMGLTFGALASGGSFAAASPVVPSPTVLAPADTSGTATFAGTRVNVQLVTLGAVLVLVLGVGSAAYFVRKKLGLDVQSGPDEPPSSQH